MYIIITENSVLKGKKDTNVNNIHCRRMAEGYHSPPTLLNCNRALIVTNIATSPEEE